MPFSYLQPLLRSGNHAADGAGRLSPTSSPEVSPEPEGTGARAAGCPESGARRRPPPALPARLQLANGSPRQALPLSPPLPLRAPSPPPHWLSSPPLSAGFAERTAPRTLASPRVHRSPGAPPPPARPGPRPSGAPRSGASGPEDNAAAPSELHRKGKRPRAGERWTP